MPNHCARPSLLCVKGSISLQERWLRNISYLLHVRVYQTNTLSNNHNRNCMIHRLYASFPGVCEPTRFSANLASFHTRALIQYGNRPRPSRTAAAESTLRSDKQVTSVLQDMLCDREVKTLVPADEPVGNATDDNSQQNWSGVVHIRSGYWKLGRERHPNDDE